MKNEFQVDITALEDITRHAGDKTNIAVAIRMNISRKTVSDVFNGKIFPSSAFMYAFVSAYNVEPERAGNIFFKRNLRST